MKGEYVLESKNDNNMFAKLHSTHRHHQNYLTPLPPPQPLQHHHPHHFQQTSEDENTSRSSGAAAAITALTTADHDGGTIELVRRPRGRPPGSKNKPKPPIIITREPEPSMSPYILEVPVNADVIHTVSSFSRRRNTGLCVFSATGAVVNVNLRQPTSSTPASSVIFHGRYDILSLSATFLHPTTSSQVPSVTNHVAISLAGPQGQIFGGEVVGPLVAASTVYIMAASFNHPSFHRLPVVEDEARDSVSGGVEKISPAESGGGDSGGMGMFASHLGNDIIWAPTARPPPQQHQHQHQQPPPQY